MTLKAVVQSDIADVFLTTDDFSENITYTPAAGGGGTTFDAIVTHQPLILGTWSDGEGEVHRAMVFVDDADVAVPVRGDTISITVGGTAYDYRVDAFAAAEGGWRLDAVRISEQELAGGGHRTQRSG